MSNREIVIEHIKKLEGYIIECNNSQLKKLYEDQLKYLREKLRSDDND